MCGFRTYRFERAAGKRASPRLPSILRGMRLLESNVTRRARSHFGDTARADMNPLRHPGNVPTSAILLIVSAVGSFSLLGSIVKFLAVLYSVPLLVWARYMLQAAAIVVWLGPTMGSGPVRTRQPWRQSPPGTVLLCSCF